jgi:hypothetical protein
LSLSFYRALRNSSHTHSNRSSEPSPTPPTERAVVGGDGSEAEAASSKAVVEELYRALERGDADGARGLLNPDVDCWFHGPRAQQHRVLMRLLTGAAGGGLPFKVRSVDAFGATVLAEGADATGALYWVYAWTVGPGGRVTEVRKCCNTALVVTRLGVGGAATTVCSQRSSSRRGRVGCRTGLAGTFLASCWRYEPGGS